MNRIKFILKSFSNTALITALWYVFWYIVFAFNLVEPDIQAWSDDARFGMTCIVLLSTLWDVIHDCWNYIAKDGGSRTL